MSEPLEKLCPFDKKPCIGRHCAVWSDEDRICALALIPRMISRPATRVTHKEQPVSSGLSGKFKDPLFG